LLAGLLLGAHEASAHVKSAIIAGGNSLQAIIDIDQG